MHTFRKIRAIRIVSPYCCLATDICFVSLATGFSYAGTSLVAQYTGYGDKRKAEKSAAQTILAMLALSFAIMIIFLIFTKPLLSGLLKLEGSLFELSSVYVKLIAIGMPFSFFNANNIWYI